MQAFAVNRRCIVVPLDDVAHKAILEEDATDRSLEVLHLEVTDTIFDAIWTTGLICDINDATGRLIGDYEDEEIPADQVPKIRHSVQARLVGRSSEKEVTDFFRDLIEMCHHAERINRPLFWIL